MPGPTCGGARRFAREEEGLVESGHDGVRVVQGALPGVVPEGAEDGGGVEVAVHPGGDVAEEGIAGRLADASEGLDDGIADAEAEIVGARVQLAEKRRTDGGIRGGAEPQGVDAAHGEKLEGGAPRGLVGGEVGEAEGDGIGAGRAGPAGLGEGVGEVRVDADAGQAGAAAEEIVEGLPLAGDGLAEGAGEGIGGGHREENTLAARGAHRLADEVCWRPSRTRSRSGSGHVRP